MDVIDEKLLTRSSITERADDDLLSPAYRQTVRIYRERAEAARRKEWADHHRRLAIFYRNRADEHEAKAFALSGDSEEL